MSENVNAEQKIDQIRDIVSPPGDIWTRMRAAEVRASRYKIALKAGIPYEFVETPEKMREFYQALLRHPKAHLYLPVKGQP